MEYLNTQITLEDELNPEPWWLLYNEIKAEFNSTCPYKLTTANIKY
jgi:hypothetical protein